MSTDSILSLRTHLEKNPRLGMIADRATIRETEDCIDRGEVDVAATEDVLRANGRAD